MIARVLLNNDAAQNRPKASAVLPPQRESVCGSGVSGLRVNEPEDVYEQEADRVAEHVMRMPEPRLAPDREQSPPDVLVQKRTPHDLSGLVEVPPIVRAVLSSAGQPLDAASRQFFEPRFGHDFGKVRVHADGEAQQSAKSIHARAFAAGQDIVLGAGQYFPGTSSGRSLLAHELAHVVQQQGASTSATSVHQPGEGAAPSALMIQRTEGPDGPESAPDASLKWTISEQPGAGAIRDPNHGFAPARKGQQSIPPGTIVSPREYREVSGKAYAYVEWSGGNDWVLQSDLLAFDETYATRRGEDAYRQTTKSFATGTELTSQQEELLSRARGFIDDGSIRTPEKMDRLGLAPELLSRLKTFYRFLLEEKLITDQDFDMSGVRTPQDAHEKSTKWMLNNENMGKDNVLFAREGREEFARLLVKINGIDLVLQKEWADKLQVEKLSAALTGIISARVDECCYARVRY